MINSLDIPILISPPPLLQQDGASLLAASPELPLPAAPLLHPVEPGAGGGGCACPPSLPPLPPPGIPPGPEPGPQPLPLPPLLFHHHQQAPRLPGQGEGDGAGGG